jgi:hypothetical protein
LPILIAWAYVIAWWLLADLVKVLILRVFDRYDDVNAKCKETGAPHPRWVRALDTPADWVNRVGDILPSPSFTFARTLVSSLEAFCFLISAFGFLNTFYRRDSKPPVFWS